MTLWTSWIILFLCAFSHLQAQEELPFWRQKTKLYNSIKNNRRVVVSVDTITKDKVSKIRVNGVGVVNVPMNFAIEQATRFEDLPSVSSYFKKVVHKREKNEVYFHMRALGFQVRFIKVYKWGHKDNQRAQLDWHVTWGRLKGMVGHYEFRKVSPGKTEIVIWATLKKYNIPLPEFMLNFTLEVIAEKVAQKMRTFIEDSYRKQAMESADVKK